MKFTDGFWLIKQGVSVNYAACVYDYELYDDSVVLYAPCSKIYHRGQTLGGPVITVKLSSPAPEVIKVQAFHFKGIKDQDKSYFKINEQKNHKVEVKDFDEYIFMKTGNLSVKIKKSDWHVEFFNGEEKITDSGWRNLAYVIDENKSTYMCEQLALGVGEYVYGLGERFTPFIKNGQVVDIWNADGGTASEQAYKNIPFYVSNKGYGVFVNSSSKVSFEVGSEKVERVSFSVPGEYLEYFVINGPTIKEVLKRYTDLTGKPSLPPAWSFGLWLTTSFITSYDEKTVNSFIDGMFERDIPLHVFHFDCFWMREYQWCDFEWDCRYFPDPQAILKRLKEKGLKICVWINPYIGQKSKLFDEGMKNGYLLKRPNGDVWQWDLWQPGMAIVDFTNPDACKWFSDKLKRLVDMGVDCFKTDFGERIPTDVVYFDGSDPEKMHNYYTFLYNKVVFETLQEKLGKNALVFARSATVGGQQFPVHWGGDCTASYDSMAESLRGGLSLCLSGFGFWSHDISGFENTATPDLYKRWVAFGLLSSHSRLHGNSSYRVPWLFDEEAVDVLRFFTKLKCRLMPYLFTVANEAAQKGIPMMRAMILEFQDDPTCAYLDRQYMLGDSLLVAPIFNEKGDVTYYLPEGRWVNLITNQLVIGGSWKKENHNYLSLPLMVRENSIIAFGNDEYHVDYDYTNNIEFHVFELDENVTIEKAIYNTKAEVEQTIKLDKKGNSIEIKVSNTSKPWSVILRRIDNVKKVSGAEVIKTELGVKLIPSKNATSISVEL
ncbi:alpha-xylosidase [Caldicellulosiruptoraceae bacterium PP1]